MGKTSHPCRQAPAFPHLCSLDFYHSSFTTRALAHYLGGILPGRSLIQAFSTGKDELLLGFTGDFYLKFNWADGFMFFSFPSELPRAGKNTINQFRSVVGEKVLAVHDGGFDRFFRLEMESGHVFLLKAFGKQSNLLLFAPGEDRCSLHFRLHHKGDGAALLSSFSQRRSFDYDAANCRDAEAFRAAYPFVLPALLAQWDEAGFFRLQGAEQEARFRELSAPLVHPQFYVDTASGQPRFTFFPGEGLEAFTDFAEAVNQYTRAFLGWQHFRSLKQRLQVHWQGEMSRLGRLLNDLQKEEKRLQERPGYRLMADLIMAHLTEIPEGAERISLPDFSGTQSIDIRLQGGLTALQNAEAYYRKARNENIEAAILASRLNTTREAYALATARTAEVDAASNSKALRNIPLPQKKQQQEQDDLPFHTFSIQGFTVWVGKHARANELLLNQYSKKNDIWFHARDVAGSHVVVRSARGLEGLPKPVMEGAARLAAWFSKGRSQGWLPVQYTERKYVRKRKGGAPGEVLVEKEKVLVVQPGLP